MDLHQPAFRLTPLVCSDLVAEYVARQRDLAERGAPLRQRLVAECDRLLKR